MNLLPPVLAPDGPPFAMLRRSGYVEILLGDVSRSHSIVEGGGLLLALPFRQIAERGYPCHDDGTPVLAMRIRERQRVPVAEALRRLPDTGVTLTGGAFDPSDEEYRAIVRRVIADEIGTGEGSNFVIRRTFSASLGEPPRRAALALFRRLLATEPDAYWTFIVHWGHRILVGASPERHVSLRDGAATMNPISGTYRYPPSGPSLAGLQRFLADPKETDELFMVVDEELKMMARVCEYGGRVRGPQLTEMAHLAHTGYVIEGRTRLGVPDVLRYTMFAPTVTGSPLRNACRVITRYERTGRGYYGGVLALAGDRTLDSAILIRTADIDLSGRMTVGVGATLVRHSDPDAEVAETRTKLSGLLAGTTTAPPPRFGADHRVRRALAARNERLSRFWLAPAESRAMPVAALAGRRLLLIDAEDDFAEMLAQQICALGPEVTVRGFDGEPPPEAWHAVIVGPGPGDPNDLTDPKIGRLRDLTRQLLRSRTPLLSVCLGHQVLAALLGLPLRRKEVPSQGEQREIDFFGYRERVGFYNTFAAYSDTPARTCPLTGDPVEIARDRTNGEVYGLRKRCVRSVQFHIESVLTRRGPALLADLLTTLLREAGRPPRDDRPLPVGNRSGH